MSNIRRRVKLYVLDEKRQWIDHGTGHVTTLFAGLDKHTNTKGIVLVVRSEEDGKVLLESRILTDTIYQKQQETLVVWSEADNDFALSFQEKDGCGDIWEKICQVQGIDPSVDVTQDVTNVNDGDITQDDEDGLNVTNSEDNFEEVQDYSAIELPPCELGKLEEIAELIQSVLPSPMGRSKVAIAIEEDLYIKKLLDIFHICEDLENTESLHILFEIFKSIFSLERNSLFEVMFQPDVIMDVVGVLEYDPRKKQPTPHRHFLNNVVKFNEVIPITNKELLNKIHITYRVQYIKDILVPAPSLFDENMSTMTSFLFFNKIDIVNIIQADAHFLDDLFSKLTDDESFDERRKDTVLLLRELCHLSQSMQLENRDNFIQMLINRNLLTVLQPLLNLDDASIKNAVIDIVYCIVDHNPAMIRNFLIKEAKTSDEDSLLLNMFIELLHTSFTSVNGTDVILMQLVKNLLDTDNMGLGPNKMEKAEFLGFFYRHCMHVLTEPLIEATNLNELTGKDDYDHAVMLDHIVELLTFCVLHHYFQIRQYILGKDMLKRVLVLMQSRHKFLSLAALRFCRKIIGLKDELYNRHIIVGKLLTPVVEAFVRNGATYNLLNSAIIELFEFIRAEDSKTLKAYIMESHYEAFSNIDYVGTFQGLRIKYEQDKDREENPYRKDEGVGMIHTNDASRKRRDDRVLDEYEEDWFESEDNSTTKPLTNKLKDVDLLDNLPTVSNGPSSPQNNRLVPTPAAKPASPKFNSNTPLKPTSNTVKIGIVTPQNFTAEANISPVKGEMKTSPPNTPRPSSPKLGEHIFAQSKPLPGLNNKPLLSIKINSLLNNGEAVNEKKSLFTSLVDYPDDDDDELSDDDVPQSPCKKQRVEST